MSFYLFQCCRNFIDPDAICWFILNSSQYPMISFNFLNHQFFHVLLAWIFTPFLACTHFTPYSFQTVWPHYMLLSFTICFLLEKFHFDASFKWLAHSFCSFPFAEEITLFAFVYSSCIPSTPLSSFLSSNFDTLYSFPLLLQHPPHCTIIFPYVCMDLLRIHMCPVLFPTLYCLFFASVHLHQGISTLLPLPYLWPCFCIPHMFFFLKLPYTQSWLELLMPSLCCVSITNNLCFGTHFSFRTTLMLRTLSLSCCHTIIWLTMLLTEPATYVIRSDSCFMTSVADD